jgi:hypothetical protein
VRTFIIRLQEDPAGSGRTAAASPRLRGVVDEVATGMRTTFRDDRELVTALMSAICAARPGPSWGGADRVPRTPLPDDPHSVFREK